MTSQKELNTKNCIEDLQSIREEFEIETNNLRANFDRELEELVIQFQRKTDELLKQYGVRDEDKTRDTKR
jgi:hypothetical protein